MGIFFRPRRPLMRLAAGATTAAVAYNAGKRGAQNSANEQDQNEALAEAQNQQAQLQAQINALSSQQAPAPAPASDPLAELERLAKLRESGVLTDAEFAAMKAKLIGG
ncbi:SHOCT domain-containing protein [Nonomuraea sp. NPDC050556]|uniref:SHOCT domain-containing protein n=1 Tax=Nonomuraea sp. NPDC050556 TaxID=3364369 RepID=UPI00378B72B3